jgi:nitrite reductase/ring-hydroxylating ferredoxin subunit
MSAVLPGTGRQVRVGTLDEVATQGCVVVTGDHGPIAVFHDGSGVFAVDNRCPHMGFPLHRGTVQDGILTCHWHEARFDLASGCTFDLFADDVPTYPVEVRDGEVWLTPFRSRAGEADHWRRRLVEGMEQNISLVIAKSVIRLLHLGVDAAEIQRLGTLFGARNRASGWASGQTILAALGNLCDHLSPDDQALPLYQGLIHVASDCAGQPPRRPLQPLETDDISMDRLKRWFRQFIEVRNGQGAERILLTTLANGHSSAEVADMMFTAATDHFYRDGGHMLDFLNKAFETLDRIGWEHAEEILPTLEGGLARSGRSEENQSWRQPVDLVSLLRSAFEELPARFERGRGRSWTRPDDFLDRLLSESPPTIVATLLDAVDEGATPDQIGTALCQAAALRICRFSAQNEFGDWIQVLHTFTYCNALHQALRRAPSWELLRGAFHGAMAIYLDRFLNVPPARLPDERRAPKDLPEPPLLREHFMRLLNTQHQVDPAAHTVHQYVGSGQPVDPLLRTFIEALLREDAEFHTFQMVEAGLRCYADLPATRDGEHVLIAIARYLASHSPTNRTRGQTFSIAQRLHRGDALYEEAPEES